MWRDRALEDYIYMIDKIQKYKKIQSGEFLKYSLKGKMDGKTNVELNY